MPHTNGFATDTHALQHFGAHGALLGVSGLDEYLVRADHFLGGLLASLPDVEECRRPDGDIVRYNDRTGEIGMLSATGIIRSYYVAQPTRHGRATNRQYFNEQCNRSFVPAL